MEYCEKLDSNRMSIVLVRMAQNALKGLLEAELGTLLLTFMVL